MSNALPGSFRLIVRMTSKPSIWMCDRKTLAMLTKALKPNRMPRGSRNASELANDMLACICDGNSKAEIDRCVCCEETLLPRSSKIRFKQR